MDEKGTDRGSKGTVSTTLVVVALVVTCVNVGMMFAGAVRTGVSANEPKHVERLNGYFDTGWFVPSEMVEGSEPTDPEDTYVYGPVAGLFGHATAVLAGVEELGEAEATSEAFAVRHLSMALLGLLGILAVGMSASRLLRDWRWGVVAASVLSAIPLWTGHAMFNIKDTPVAAGFAIFAAGLIGLVRPRSQVGFRSSLSDGVLLFFGFLFAIGTRPGMWVIFGLTAATALASSIWVDLVSSGRQSALRNGRGRLAVIGVSSVLAYFGLLGIYPKAFAHPIRLAWDSATGSAKFDRWDGITLTNGVASGQPPPWWYVPAWIVHQIPFLILCALLVAIGVCSRMVWSAWRRKFDAEKDQGMLSGALLLLVPLLFIPVSTVVLGSHLNGGIRHLLFLVPLIAVVSALGLGYVSTKFDARSRGGRKVALAFPMIVSLALVIPTFDQVRLFPYNYTYFNEIATIQPINGRWSTDFWRTSFREMAKSVDPDARSVCISFPAPGVAVAANSVASRYESSCADNSFMKYYFDDDSAEPLDPPLSSSEYLLVAENKFGVQFPENCQLLSTVSRPLRWRNVVMSYLARCDLNSNQ